MADPVVAEYAKAAERYDEKWAFYVEATTRETLKRMPMTATARVLDVGCGTGELLRRLRAKYPEAVLAGLDPVAEMLAVARDKLSGKEDLRIGYADSLPWNTGTFDVVVSCNMFHYISHPVEALREMTRVLRPGGSLVLTDWCDDYLACRVCNIYLRLTNRPGRPKKGSRPPATPESRNPPQPREELPADVAIGLGRQNDR